MYDMNVKMYAWDVHICMIWMYSHMHGMEMCAWFGGVNVCMGWWAFMHGRGVGGVCMGWDCMHDVGIGVYGNACMVWGWVVYAWMGMYG
jgi:hypothetical protein